MPQFKKCTWPMKSGPRKGQPCGESHRPDRPFCYRHTNTKSNNPVPDPEPEDEVEEPEEVEEESTPEPKEDRSEVEEGPIEDAPVGLSSKYKKLIVRILEEGEQAYQEASKPKSKSKSSKKSAKSEPKPKKERKPKASKVVPPTPESTVNDSVAEQIEFEGEDLEEEEVDIDEELGDLDERARKYSKAMLRYGGWTVEGVLTKKFGLNLEGFAKSLSEEPDMVQAFEEICKEYLSVDVAEVIGGLDPLTKGAIIAVAVAAHTWSKNEAEGGRNVPVFPLPSELLDQEVDLPKAMAVANISPPPVPDPGLLSVKGDGPYAPSEGSS